MAKCPFSGIDVEDCPFVIYYGDSCETDAEGVCPIAKIADILESIAKALKKEE